MIALILTHWRALAVAGALLGAALGGWTANGWRYEAKMAALVRSYDAAATDAKARAQAQADALVATYQQADAERYRQLTESQDEIADLRAAVAAGTRRLRVNATCPGSSGMPQAAGAPGMGDDAAPRLADDARDAYFRLREQVTQMQKQVEWCQGVLGR